MQCRRESENLEHLLQPDELSFCLEYFRLSNQFLNDEVSNLFNCCSEETKEDFVVSLQQELSGLKIPTFYQKDKALFFNNYSILQKFKSSQLRFPAALVNEDLFNLYSDLLLPELLPEHQDIIFNKLLDLLQNYQHARHQTSFPDEQSRKRLHDMKWYFDQGNVLNMLVSKFFLAFPEYCRNMVTRELLQSALIIKVNGDFIDERIIKTSQGRVPDLNMIVRFLGYCPEIMTAQLLHCQSFDGKNLKRLLVNRQLPGFVEVRPHLYEARDKIKEKLTERRERKQREDRVTEFKYSLHCSVRVSFHRSNVQFDLEAGTLPLALISQTSQKFDATFNLRWWAKHQLPGRLGGPDGEFFPELSMINVKQFREFLTDEFNSHFHNLSFTEKELNYVVGLAARGSEQISKDRIFKEAFMGRDDLTSKKSKFTFWRWFCGAINLIKMLGEHNICKDTICLMSRTEAETVLGDRNQDGMFLLRISENDTEMSQKEDFTGRLVMSVYANGLIHHIRNHLKTRDVKEAGGLYHILNRFDVRGRDDPPLLQTHFPSGKSLANCFGQQDAQQNVDQHGYTAANGRIVINIGQSSSSGKLDFLELPKDQLWDGIDGIVGMDLDDNLDNFQNSPIE